MATLRSNIEYLQATHDLLPKIENFTFIVPANFGSYNCPKFIFPNVKIVFIKDKCQTFDQTKLTLKPLEKLTINMGAKQLIENEWIEFIENHKYLNSISITERAYFHANELNEFAEV